MEGKVSRKRALPGVDYISLKTKEAAERLSRAHGVDSGTAYLVTRMLWLEARRSIIGIMGRGGEDGWQRMSLKEKTAICSVVVKNLLDKRKVAAFVNGRSKGIV
ncbi:MAG: hypothetical protein HY883_04755 [Deltaproteobacteria bacterium]|nr:hypothetical protein [Deltaproteobacteria bacterium]